MTARARACAARAHTHTSNIDFLWRPVAANYKRGVIRASPLAPLCGMQRRLTRRAAGQVEDHNPPHLMQIFAFLERAAAFAAEDEEHVLAVSPPPTSLPDTNT